MHAPPPPAPPGCSRCNTVIGETYYMLGNRLLCHRCGARHEPTEPGPELSGPFVNDRPMVGPGGDVGI